MYDQIIKAAVVLLMVSIVINEGARQLKNLLRREVRNIVKKNYGFLFRDPFEAPFEIHGISDTCVSRKQFLRLQPHEKFSKGVNIHAKQTSGIRIKFNTSSNKIMIKAILSNKEVPPHCTQYGTIGFDIYSVSECGNRWVKTLVPHKNDFVVSDTVYVGGGDVMICLPQYAGVVSLKIGIQKGHSVDPPKVQYAINLPIVFYGSSITQGASASRTGTSFPFLVSQHLNVDYVNYGFSESAKGEQTMAEHIARSALSALVMEYDHNADTIEELEATHFNFYRTIRNAHNDIPIIFVSRISVGFSCSFEEGLERHNIINHTYKAAQDFGDNKVFFIAGTTLTSKNELSECLADGKHPNDVGMRLIARAIENTLVI